MKKRKKWSTYSPVEGSDRPNEEVKGKVTRLIAEARKDAMAGAFACKAAAVDLEAGFRRKLYLILAGGYAVTQQLDQDWAAWKTFIKLPYWDARERKPRRDKHAHQKMFWVMTYVFDVRNSLVYDRVWKYARALEYLNRSGVPAENVVARLEEKGGIEALCRKAAETDPRVFKKLQAAQDDYFDLSKDGSGKRGRDRPPSPLDEAVLGYDDPPAKTKSSAERTADPIGEAPKADILDVEMNPERLAKLLRMAKGRKAVITVRHVGIRDGWHRFRATGVKRLPFPE